jgi:hypothetical protein
VIALDLSVKVEITPSLLPARKSEVVLPQGNPIPLQPRYLWESLRDGFNGKVPQFVHYGHKRPALADYVVTSALLQETLQSIGQANRTGTINIFQSGCKVSENLRESTFFFGRVL